MHARQDDELETLIATPATGKLAPLPARAGGSEPLAATLFAGRYDIAGLLGQGAMGSVYRAFDRELQEPVALKVLKADLAANGAALERFRQEVRLARRIAHRNVVRTFDLGEHGAARFLTMELVDGTALSRHLSQRRRMDVVDFALVASQLCAGLQAAHQAGVLHRDLKPDNVLVARDGRVAITDFGIAQAAGALANAEVGVAGTPAYMAPEQLQPETVLDARADIYALGALLFELLAGRRAWPGNDAMAVAMARLLQPPPDLRQVVQVPDALADVILTAMAADRNERFESAAAVGHALAQAVAPGYGLGLTGRRVSPLNRLPTQTAVEPATAATSSTTSATWQRALAALAPAAQTSALWLQPASAVAVPQSHAKTLAVLPLQWQGEGSDWLAAALTEEIIDALTMTPGLKVRPLHAVKHVAADNPQAAGQQLAVAAVLTGALRQAGDRWRLTMRATGVADGFQLWAQRFEAAENELLVQVDAIAKAAAAALTVDLHAQPHQAATDPRAVDLYLRGRQRLREEWIAGGGNALQFLGEALALAPHDPHILAAYATACARATFYAKSSDEVLAAARLASDRAIAAAPRLADGWAARAQLLMYSGDMPGAAAAFHRAVLRAPGLAYAQGQLGSILLEARQYERALEHLRAAEQIDPFNVVVRGDLVRLHALRGENGQVDRLLGEPMTDLTNEIGRRFSLIRLMGWRGLPAGVEMPPEDMVDNMLYKVVHLMASGYTEAVRANQLPQGAREVLLASTRAENQRLAASRSQFVAEIFALAGDPDAAMRVVEAAVAGDLQDYAWMADCPALDSLRSQPQWPRLQAKIAARAERIVAAVDAVAADEAQ